MSVVDDRPIVDVTNPQFYEDPNDIIAWVHANEPVYLCDARPRYPRPFWLMSKWEDVRTVLGDSRLFTSRYGNMLNSRPGESVPTAGAPEQTEAEAHGEDVDPRVVAIMRTLVTVEPDEHRRMRGSVSHNFRPRNVREKWESATRQMVTELLDSVEPDDVVDFIPTIAKQLPMVVTCAIFGLPTERAQDFIRWAEADHGSMESVGSEAHWDQSTVIEMYEFFKEEIDKRLTDPRDDLISDFATNGYQSGKMTLDETIMMLWINVTAALDTTLYLVGSGMQALFEYPDERAKLLQDPSLLPGAVAEMLRWTTPVRYLKRTATEDTEIRGVKIRAGEEVVANFYFANRDPEIFPDPYVFNVTRDTGSREHVSFGYGPHYCLGAHVGLLEGRVLFEELFKRYPNIEPGGEATYRPSVLWNGIEHLPVVFRR